jgi:ribosomal-protein-alanine N-acetyltransferase
MTEVLQTLLPYWQKKFNLHRIEAEIEPPNVASQKLLLKNGFELEGRKKDAEIKNGEFISLDFYARILD